MNKAGYRAVGMALGVGALSGVRSMSGPASVRKRLFKSRSGSGVMQVVAGLEFLVDKTPWIPNRTAAPSMVARAVSGALSATAISAVTEPKLSRRSSILLGAAAAIGATYLTFYFRKALVRRFGLDDRVVGILEDGAAIGAGRLISSLAFQEP